MTWGLPATLALPVLISMGCDRDDDQLTTNTTPHVTAEVEDVQEDPERYFGKTVKLVGDVDDVYGQRSFELEGLDLIFEEEVLVLTKSPIVLGNQALQKDEMVRVHGTVKKFSATELEQELGWKLDEEIGGEWENRPVIVATGIDAVREYARWSESDAQKGQVIGLYAFYTAPATERSTLQDMSVTFEDTRVNQVNNGKIWVGWSHPGVMVVPAAGVTTEDIRRGDLVDIDGRFVSAASAQQVEGIDRLARAEKMALEQDGVYVEAQSISKSKQDRAAELTTGAIEAQPAEPRDNLARGQEENSATRGKNTTSDPQRDATDSHEGDETDPKENTTDENAADRMMKDDQRQKREQGHNEKSDPSEQG